MKKFLIPIFVFLILVVPIVSLAQWESGKGLVPCDNVTEPCGFIEFMGLINKVINFILFVLAVPIATIMFVYAGFLLITAGGSEAKTKAKNIFFNAVIGIVLVAISWLIVKTLLSILGYEGAWIGF